MERTLSADECRRADRFVYQRDRDRFIVGRGVLRTILGRYVERNPADLEFHYNAFGKPTLSAGEGLQAVRFNLSHADDTALHAIALGREVGVDIERVRADFATEEIAERFFSKRESAAFRAVPLPARLEAFFACWTRKEAYIKARGDGLSIPLDSFDVAFTPGQPAALLGVENDPKEVARWCMQELFPGPGYVAALVVEGREWSLRCWQWSDVQ